VHGNLSLLAEGSQACDFYLCTTEKGLTSCKECAEVVCRFARTAETVCPVRSYYERKRCYARKISEHFLSIYYKGQPTHLEHKVSAKTVTRLRWYLFALDELLSCGVSRLSSEDMSRKVGVRSSLIRRDLSHFGEFGTPSIGYDAAHLRQCLARILRVGERRAILWVGASRLADDESLLRRLAEHSFEIVAVLDAHPESSPKTVSGLQVRPLSALSDVMREHGAEGAVIATAEEDAQRAADALTGAGIRGILNLTSAVIVVPTTVCMRSVDVVAEMFALSYFCAEMHAETEALSS